MDTSPVLTQLNYIKDRAPFELIFPVELPAFGFGTYFIEKAKTKPVSTNKSCILFVTMTWCLKTCFQKNSKSKNKTSTSWKTKYVFHYRQQVWLTNLLNIYSYSLWPLTPTPVWSQPWPTSEPKPRFRSARIFFGTPVPAVDPVGGNNRRVPTFSDQTTRILTWFLETKMSH